MKQCSITIFLEEVPFDPVQLQTMLHAVTKAVLNKATNAQNAPGDYAVAVHASAATAPDAPFALCALTIHE